MPSERPDVPPEIETFLVGLYARAGQLGGSIGGSVAGVIAGPGGAAAGRGGARAGARSAARLATKVEERSGAAPGPPEQVVARLAAAFPRATRLPAESYARLAVPVGMTGLQQIVIDLEISPADGPENSGRVRVRLRGFGKEGLIGRKPTRTVTDQAWAAVIADQS